MSHRDSFTPDVPLGLGKKVEHTKPAPQPHETSPGILEAPDGKLSTNLPLPEAPQIKVPDVVIDPDACWPFPHSEDH